MTKEKPRLGRGLASLLGDAAVPVQIPEERLEHPSVSEHSITHPEDTSATRVIPTNRVDPNPYQPRTQTDPEALSELVESIRQHGIIQPIIVRPKEDRYELVAGQRRLQAVRKLEINAIPAVIKSVSDQQLMEIALIENIQREDLNCVDRAQAYKKYQETFNLTTELVAERLGQDRTTVTNYIRLLSLSDQIIELLRTGRLSMGHARALAGFENADEQIKLAFKVVQMGMSVRQTEQMVSKAKAGKSEKKQHEKNPNVADLEQQMTRVLSTKVQILPSRKKDSGKVVIEYYSLDDFDRILETICGQQREEL